MTARRSRLVFVLNMATAPLFGVSLLFALIAPWNMAMMEWQLFEDVLITAFMCGGLPLGCVISVALCQRLVSQGQANEAVILATIPIFLGVALLAWVFMAE